MMLLVSFKDGEQYGIRLPHKDVEVELPDTVHIIGEMELSLISLVEEHGDIEYVSLWL